MNQPNDNTNHQNHPPHIPDDLTPQQAQAMLDNFLTNDGNYEETELSIHKTLGLSTVFGNQETIRVLDDKVMKITQNQGFIIGSGKRVSDAEQVGGICKFCFAENQPHYESGSITRQQLELRAMYDVAAQCFNCREIGCEKHIRPTAVPDGVLVPLCPICQAKNQSQIKKEKRKQLVKSVISFLFAPFIEKD